MCSKELILLVLLLVIVVSYPSHCCAKLLVNKFSDHAQVVAHGFNGALEGDHQ